MLPAAGSPVTARFARDSSSKADSVIAVLRLRGSGAMIMIYGTAQAAGIEANKANIYRLVDEAIDCGILEVVDETRGEFAEQLKARIRAWRRAFPDFHTTIETMIAEGDCVAFHLRDEGTHEGEFPGLASSGRRVDFRSMVFNRFSNGIVVERVGVCTIMRVPWSSCALSSERG